MLHGAHGRNLTNMTEPSTCGGNADYFDHLFSCDVRIANLEAGEGDDFEFVEWQARMRRLDREKEREEFERRRLGGLLSQEESIIARQKIVEHNKDLAAKMKAEVCSRQRLVFVDYFLYQKYFVIATYTKDYWLYFLYVIGQT